MNNIIFAHSVNVIGGAERVTLSIIEGISSEYQPILIAPEGEDLGPTAKNAGAIYESLTYEQPDWRKPLRSLMQIRECQKLLKKYKPQLVHTGDLLALRFWQPACKMRSIPIFCHVHFPYEKPFMHWVFANRYQPHTFIFCSQELKENLEPELSKYCPTSNMKVIHNGVDTKKFTPVARPDNPTPRVGIVANLQFRKGHDDFLEMAKIVLEKGIRAHFDIIGGDILQEPREALLKQKAKSLGIFEHVTFHGQVSNVLKHLHQLDVYVCASHEEAFPISILEAMACGKAIVSTNVNGIPEAIHHPKDGILTEAKNPLQLALAVKSIMQDKILKKRLESEARCNVVTLFSKEIFTKKILNLYQKKSEF